MHSSSRLVPHFALLLAMITWSSSFIALKVALSAYSPFTVMTGRMLTATLICLPMLKEIWQTLKDPFIRKLVILCVVCEPCFYFLFETFALRYTTSGQAGMVIALLPLGVALGAWFLLKEKPTVRIIAGFLLAIAGVVWLSMKAIATESAPNPLLGNGLEALAVICAIGYTLCARRLTGYVAPTRLTAIMGYAGFLFFFPLAMLPITIQPVPLEVNVPHWLPMACIIYLGGIVTFAGYGMYNFGISRLTAGQAAAYTNLIPVMTLGMGVLWLGETVMPEQYMAAALVVGGVMLSQGGGAKTKQR